MLRKILSILLFFSVLLTVNAENLNLVEYPQDYRNWQHVKSMVIQKGHPLENPFAGIHHIYANKLAIEGLQQGDFKNGSMFVFDLLDVDYNNHALTEGKRKLIGVMKKDRVNFNDTGGWGFEGFAGNSHKDRLTTDGGQSCFGCHTQRSKHDFVFTTLRD